MQFTGHSLPVHHWSGTFTLSHIISWAHLRAFFRLLAIGMCHIRCLRNCRCDHHRAEITIMQFIGQSLPAHHVFYGTVRIFTLSHIVSQAVFYTWIEHQILSGIRDSRKPGRLWGMMRGVGGVRKPIQQSWLAKGLGLELLCWDFKGFQEEIQSDEASTRVSGISTRTMHQSITPSLSQTIWARWTSRQFHTLPIVQTLLPVTFGYSLSSENVIMRQLRR